MERHLVLDEDQYKDFMEILNSFRICESVTISNNHKVVICNIPASRITFMLAGRGLPKVKFEALEA